MTPYEQQRFDFIYEQHITNLRVQGKSPTLNPNLPKIRLIPLLMRLTSHGGTSNALHRFTV